MKYIITKDGEIIKRYPEFYGRKDYCGIPIIKEADTIEELCDEFVLVHHFKEANYSHCEVLINNKEILIESIKLRKQDKDYNTNEFDIYGAIWTDKGLIYVAKMNEKGELELL